MPVRLGVNIDHVATLRQARRCAEPDPVAAAALAELAGADQITVHLREDRRHINDRDVRLLRQTVRTRLNLEMGLANDIQDIALEVVPEMVTLVPERREEVTTEGGLSVVDCRDRVAGFAEKCAAAGIAVSCFIDPEPTQVEACFGLGVMGVEFHTGPYAHAFGGHNRGAGELHRLARAAAAARAAGLAVFAGHGLDSWNLRPMLDAVPEVEEVNIGHHIISRAVLVGLEQAIRDIRALLG